EEYPGTGSAVWSRVVLAQQQMADKNYNGAVKQYEDLISTVGESSPLYPLLEYGIALAYESSEQYSEAIAHYEILQDKPGFASLAYLGLARNQEALGRIDKARENYEKAGGTEGISPSVREFVDYKLATI
ncbi:MAG: tetratricopeptide repeat protein, partial [Desulfobia sp.]